ISKKLFVVFVLLAIAISVFMNTYSAIAQYRGTNLYFSGDSVSHGETTTSGDWVSRINSVHRTYYPASSGVRESGVYPLAGYEDIDPYGSAGYVMPNKQNNGSAAIGVA